MASESQRIRDTLINPPSNRTTTHFVPVSSSFSKYDRPRKLLSYDTPRSLFGDYDHLPSSPPLPPVPDPPTLTPEQKKQIKRQKEKQKEQLHLTLQQKESKKLDRQAKLKQKQKQAEYQQMYQNQHDYIHALDHKAEKRQQLSLPIYPTGQWDPLPTAEMYYHESRHYRQSKATSNSQHHNSFSSSSSTMTSLTMTSSSQIKNSSPEKTRSMSLKSTTKSMYDLRPWTGSPQSPTFDYISYDSDDTSGTRGWDSLMDTLYSPSTDSPNSWSNSSLDVPYVATSGSKVQDPDLDLVETALSAALSTDKLSNGNGKYLLVLGANGRTGIELVKQGLERNYRVTAFVRDDKLLIEDPALRKNHNLLIVRGSPTSQADLDRCVEGQDVVVNVIGARLMANDSTISSHAQVVLNNAMKKHGVRRLIAVTSYGCLGLRNYLISTKRLFSRVFMTGILKDKVLQEEIIQRDSAHLDWTIVRPITLKDGDLSEKYIVSSEALPRTDNKIKALTRKDLAHYILGIISDRDEHQAIRSIAGKPKPFKAKPYCPFERRRMVQEQAKLEKEMEIEKQQLEKKQQQMLLQMQEEYKIQQMPSPACLSPLNQPLPPLPSLVQHA
ncbi:hypothetical protein BG006_002980 [Podila minutissima]|uniref:NAD(P)-binding domain-containing protein n=1 Tax=Podila minutissima TaxID=64525 RepID=A0A9P5VNQ5_9FUNG|nr:hypothetical protein BG006_002980 [Podila minutissima]